MEVYSTCPKCNCQFDWDTSKDEQTPDGGRHPASSPNCPKCGYDVTGTNDRAPRDVSWYAKKNDVEALRRLLRPGWRNLLGLLRPKVDERNQGGFTPLMAAAMYGSIDAAAFLLQNGADIAAKNNDGQTALEIAQEYKHPAVVELLGAWARNPESAYASYLSALTGSGALIAFGPSAYRGKVVALFAKGGISCVDVETADELSACRIILLPGRILRPCQIAFCHFIPHHENQRCSKEDVSDWQDKLLGAVPSMMDKADQEQFNSCKIKFIVDIACSSAVPIFLWRELSSEKCIQFAKAIEQGYRKLLGGMIKLVPAAESTLPTLTLDLGGGVTLELVLIPAGKFTMGSPATETEAHQRNDETQHEVTISTPFYMGQYEITQAQYEAVIGSNPSRVKGAKNPVEQVSWDGAQEFCRKLSAKAGKTLRLPTEAEWEYACRAGTTTRFSSGDADSALADVAWYDANSERKPHPVGQKKPNAWGLYDMHGNVWEWCQDFYGAYAEGTATDPPGAVNGTSRVVRGGGWVFSPWSCRSANRGGSPPDPRYGGADIGFRVVVPAGSH